MERLTVATVQLGDRPCRGFDDYVAHIRSLVEGAQSAQLIVFPEYCTLPLLKPHQGVPRAELRALYDDVFGEHTQRYIEFFSSLARERATSILAGSHWTPRQNGSFNVAYFFAPSGAHVEITKQHRTASEEAMGLAVHEGDALIQLDGVDTGVLICYDVEFPELAVSLANAGADLLLVPSLTLNERGANRVELCARARAIENQVYVIASVNQTALDIPTEIPVRGVGRSAIFGPVDNRTRLADGIVARARSDGDQLVCADLDLAVLAESRTTSEAPLRRHRAHP